MKLLLNSIKYLPPRDVYQIIYNNINVDHIKEYILNDYTEFLKSLVSCLKNEFLNLISIEKDHFNNLSKYTDQINEIDKNRVELIKRAYSKMSIDMINCGIWNMVRFASIDEKEDYESNFCSKQRKFSDRCNQFINDLEGADKTGLYKNCYESDEEDINNFINVKNISGDNLFRYKQVSKFIFHLKKINNSMNNFLYQNIKTHGPGGFYKKIMIPTDHKCPPFMKDPNYPILNNKEKWEKLIQEFCDYFLNGYDFNKEYTYLNQYFL